MRLLYFFKSPQLSLSVNDILLFLRERGLNKEADELTKRANQAERLLDKSLEERKTFTSTWTKDDTPLKKALQESNKNWWQRLFN